MPFLNGWCKGASLLSQSCEYRSPKIRNERIIVFADIGLHIWGAHCEWLCCDNSLYKSCHRFSFGRADKTKLYLAQWGWPSSTGADTSNSSKPFVMHLDLCKSPILLEFDFYLWRSCACRPKALNALNEPMCKTLHRLYDDWDASPDVHAILVKGAGGKAFCAGGDVKGMVQYILAGQHDKAIRLGITHRLCIVLIIAAFVGCH